MRVVTLCVHLCDFILFYCLTGNRSAALTFPQEQGNRESFINGCCNQAPPLQVDVIRCTLKKGMSAYILSAIYII